MTHLALTLLFIGPLIVECNSADPPVFVWPLNERTETLELNSEVSGVLGEDVFLHEGDSPFLKKPFIFCGTPDCYAELYVISAPNLDGDVSFRFYVFPLSQSGLILHYMSISNTAGKTHGFGIGLLNGRLEFILEGMETNILIPSGSFIPLFTWTLITVAYNYDHKIIISLDASNVTEDLVLPLTFGPLDTPGSITIGKDKFNISSEMKSYLGSLTCLQIIPGSDLIGYINYDSYCAGGGGGSSSTTTSTPPTTYPAKPTTSTSSTTSSSVPPPLTSTTSSPATTSTSSTLSTSTTTPTRTTLTTSATTLPANTPTSSSVPTTVAQTSTTTPRIMTSTTSARTTTQTSPSSSKTTSTPSTVSSATTTSSTTPLTSSSTTTKTSTTTTHASTMTTTTMSSPTSSIMTNQPSITASTTKSTLTTQSSLSPTTTRSSTLSSITSQTTTSPHVSPSSTTTKITLSTSSQTTRTNRTPTKSPTTTTTGTSPVTASSSTGLPSTTTGTSQLASTSTTSKCDEVLKPVVVLSKAIAVDRHAMDPPSICRRYQKYGDDVTFERKSDVLRTALVDDVRHCLRLCNEHAMCGAYSYASLGNGVTRCLIGIGTNDTVYSVGQTMFFLG